MIGTRNFLVKAKNKAKRRILVFKLLANSSNTSLKSQVAAFYQNYLRETHPPLVSETKDVHSEFLLFFVGTHIKQHDFSIF